MRRKHILALGAVVLVLALVAVLFSLQSPAEPTGQSAPPAARPTGSPAPEPDSALIGNYKDVVGMLITYSFAQGLFYNADFGEIPGNAATPRGKTYCDNFRNLHYGYDDGEEGQGPLDLLPQEVADAFAAPPRGNATQREPTAVAVPFAGYLFHDDPAVRDWSRECGLVAYPARYGETGRTVFWIGQDLPVLRLDPQLEPGSPPRLLTPEESPLHPDGARLWTGLSGPPETW